MDARLACDPSFFPPVPADGRRRLHGAAAVPVLIVGPLGTTTGAWRASMRTEQQGTREVLRSEQEKSGGTAARLGGMP